MFIHEKIFLLWSTDLSKKKCMYFSTGIFQSAANSAARSADIFIKDCFLTWIRWPINVNQVYAPKMLT